MNETLAHWHSFESIQLELSNEYQHDSVKMAFKNHCILVLWSNIASALEGLIFTRIIVFDVNSISIPVRG